MTDDKIIALYFKRDEEAIQKTQESYGSRLFNLANRILEDHEDAEESVNDTYLTAWNHIPPEKPVFFYAYLAKICRFAAFGILDKRNAEKRSADIVALTDELEACIPDRSRSDQADARELAAVLNAFLATLQEEDRNLFLRRYWFGDSITEAAKRYGFSESKVKSRMFRLRHELAAFLAKEGIKP